MRRESSLGFRAPAGMIRSRSLTISGNGCGIVPRLLEKKTNKKKNHSNTTSLVCLAAAANKYSWFLISIAFGHRRRLLWMLLLLLWLWLLILCFLNSFSFGCFCFSPTSFSGRCWWVPNAAKMRKANQKRVALRRRRLVPKKSNSNDEMFPKPSSIAKQIRVNESGPTKHGKTTTAILGSDRKIFKFKDMKVDSSPYLHKVKVLESLFLNYFLVWFKNYFKIWKPIFIYFFSVSLAWLLVFSWQANLGNQEREACWGENINRFVRLAVSVVVAGVLRVTYVRH